MDFNQRSDEQGYHLALCRRAFTFSPGKGEHGGYVAFFSNYPIGLRVQPRPDKASQRRRGIVALKQAVLGGPQRLILQGLRLRGPQDSIFDHGGSPKEGGRTRSGFALPPGFLHLWGVNLGMRGPRTRSRKGVHIAYLARPCFFFFWEGGFSIGSKGSPWITTLEWRFTSQPRPL
jgi:hypothetical protein